MLLRLLRKLKGRFRLFLQKRYARFRKYILGEFAIGVVYDTKNGYLINSVQDVEIGRSLGFKGAYDYSVIEFLKTGIRSTDAIYVIGAHIGSLLIPLSASAGKVFAYEANPDTFKLLNFNIAINGLHTVTAHQMAVGDSTRKVKFYTNSVNSGGSKIKPAKTHYYYTYDNPKTIEVQMKSLDEHVRETRQAKPDGLIVDIEGSEFVALKGMQECLERSHFLYIEYMPHHLENVAMVSNEDFFALILPHYSKVRFMKDREKSIDLRTHKEDFLKKVASMRKEEKSDDLLFSK